MARYQFTANGGAKASGSTAPSPVVDSSMPLLYGAGGNLAARSCQLRMADAASRRGMTAQGLGAPDKPHPVPSAPANAVFDATGVRLRTVPFTRERVKAALL